MDKHKESLLSGLSASFHALLSPLSFSGLEEIRFRAGRPIVLHWGTRQSFLTASGTETTCLNEARLCSVAEIASLASALCSHSVYAHLSDIRDGFITLRGGHRAGLSGRAVIKNGTLSGLCEISGINLRVARAFPGCAEPLLASLPAGKLPPNTLLVGPPATGKTTLLRDLARILGGHFKVSIVDERSEIAGTFHGIPQFDVGLSTDVLDRVPKSVGMCLAVRSLSPQIIITDEIGTAADAEAIRTAACTGCRFIASIHGDDLKALCLTHGALVSLFDRAVLLGRQGEKPAILSTRELTHFD